MDRIGTGGATPAPGPTAQMDTRADDAARAPRSRGLSSLTSPGGTERSVPPGYRGGEESRAPARRSVAMTPARRVARMGRALSGVGCHSAPAATTPAPEGSNPTSDDRGDSSAQGVTRQLRASLVSPGRHSSAQGVTRLPRVTRQPGRSGAPRGWSPTTTTLLCHSLRRFPTGHRFGVRSRVSFAGRAI
jgi:hypothetical protein